MPERSMRHPSSYRDPSGFIFMKDGDIYRQVNNVFKEDFDLFVSSGCYARLVQQKLLIPHEEINEPLSGNADCYKTLKPQKIPFISYPYEWSFTMLKDAALLSLSLLKESLAFGLVLKDATPYNIQWLNGRFIFIDSLSFETYHEQKPWVAYRQFCESFLSPLLLMHYTRQSLQELFLAYPNGIPLSVTQSLLPRKTRFSLHVYLHIHLHAQVSKKTHSQPNRPVKFSKQKLLNLVQSLEGLIQRLKPPDKKTSWDNYYNEAVQRNGYLDQKKAIIEKWLTGLPEIRNAADLGANDGAFSRLLAAKGKSVLSVDFDANCINRLYQEITKNSELSIQPLVMDLSNPSPAMGVNNEERSSFLERSKTDLVLALALIHHLVIGKNIPFEMIAKMFAGMAKTLLIEFVPIDDEKVKMMLAQKEMTFTDYSAGSFETAFRQYFDLVQKEAIGDSGRTLYLMNKK